MGDGQDGVKEENESTWVTDVSVFQNKRVQRISQDGDS